MARYPLNLPERLKQDAEEQAAEQGVSLNQFILWAVAEKIGALGAEISDPRFPSITYRRGASGRPAPVIRGTGIRVQTVVIASQRWDGTPAQTAAEYGLPEAQVREALAFYQEHKTEIEANIKAEEALEADHA
jgi:uncharacterized protein (DUF433 family)